MNHALSQDDRLGRLHLPSGLEQLMLVRFEGEETLDEGFEYDVTALSSDDDIPFDDLLGGHASVELVSRASDTSDVWFDGIVTRVTWLRRTTAGTLYRLKLRPWTHLMSLRADQRVFYRKTAPEILSDVFALYQSSGPDIVAQDLRKSYPLLEYTVQYRETDLDFATRLMRRFGISSRFTSAQGQHTLTLFDEVDACPELPGGPRPLRDEEEARYAQIDAFHRWYPMRQMSTGAVRANDYHFQKPDALMQVNRAQTHTYPGGDLESYIFPGDTYPQGLSADAPLPSDVADERVALYLRQAQARDGLHWAQGDVLGLCTGMRVTLDSNAPSRIAEQRFTCMIAQHAYEAPSYSSGSQDEVPGYSGRYALQLELDAFAPPAPARGPVVGGPQTGRVVGEGEIDVDEYGRVLVHFPWDLDEANFMRCRVAQASAGRGWGAMSIPRIGMEVVVEFIEGNPDHPLVTGCVYNARNMPHYRLPHEKTRTILRTDTSQGNGWNEFSFEDKSGAEEVYLHAARDHTAMVENDATRAVARNRVDIVGNSAISEIRNNATEIIGGDLDLRIGPSQRDTFVTTPRTPYEDGGPGLGDIRPADASPLPDQHKNGRLAPTAGAGDMDLRVERDLHRVVGQDEVDRVDRDRKATIARNDTLEVAETLSIRAGKRITLECGSTSLEMDASGSITLKGVTVEQTASTTFRISAAKTDIN